MKRNVNRSTPVLILLLPIVLFLSMPEISPAQNDGTGHLSRGSIGDTTQSPANGNDRKQIRAVRIHTDVPKVDGKLDDEAWKKATFVSNFLQKEPNEGAPPNDKTKVAFLYNGDALYIGAQMYSDNPETIRALVTRRDKEGSSEQLIVSLDTFYDRRTAYSFGVTAAGVRLDYYHPEDDADPEERDDSFDAVWEAKVAHDSTGWMAEIRIPFSQLRFNNQEVQVWGVNLNRRIPARNEDIFWVVIPKNEAGWASRFGDLVGIEGIRPSRRIEVFPYAAGNSTFASDVDPNNPFDEARKVAARTGGELRMGLGPNVTLEATVNPDFGQVEADPAEVNLTQFETLFEERRPFFTEGIQYLDGIRSYYFYTRRVGAPPHGSVSSDYVDIPENTTILGAAKATGRLASGFSIGAISALTGREFAKAFDASTESIDEIEVEPLTAFNVARLQKEFGDSGSTASAMFSAVNRDVLEDSRLAEILTRQAYAGGGQWDLRFDDGMYQFTGEVGFSYIEGAPGAIERVQRSSAHYFQRPDATHVSLNPTRTSLSGYIGYVEFEKRSGHHWLGEIGIGVESPGFDSNDASLQFSSDDIDFWSTLRYRETTPGTLFHRYEIGSTLYNGWNFGGIRQYTWTQHWFDATFPNFIRLYFEVETGLRALSDNRTRGGPLMETGAGADIDLQLFSSPASRTSWLVDTSYTVDELGGWDTTVMGQVAFRPSDQWEFSVNPTYSQATDTRQYIAELEGGREATFGRRYIFSSVDRNTISTQFRLNYALTPDLSLEIYAEPFAAAGQFYDFGELFAPESQELRMYGNDGTTIARSTDGKQTITDGTDRFTLPNRDFNIRSFRSNVVFRWEWRLGSTLFLVWQQDRSASETHGNLVRLPNLWGALTAGGNNFIAVKLSYWLPVN
ncbi:hypothetical protein C6496_21070 [Candidatus Poribacteria bacterium]|nr:MAG: hypothetical protein C6496_21070 [Candidatus Poribacteria bacterium]